MLTPCRLPFPISLHGLDNNVASSSLPLPSQAFRICSANCIPGNYYSFFLIRSILKDEQWKEKQWTSPHPQDGSRKKGLKASDLSTAWQSDTIFCALEAASRKRFVVMVLTCRAISWRLPVISASSKNGKPVLGGWLCKGEPRLPAAPTGSSFPMPDHCGGVYSNGSKW